MKKEMRDTILVSILLLTVIFITPVLAGNKNQNGENGYQGTNKPSNQLPTQSKVPWPAGFLEELFSAPHVVEGCRAGGGDVMVFGGEVLGEVLGAHCCASNIYDVASIYPLPNQCCNPPDIIYPNPDYWTPGNHCLCFVMRWTGPLP